MCVSYLACRALQSDLPSLCHLQIIQPLMVFLIPLVSSSFPVKWKSYWNGNNLFFHKITFTSELDQYFKWSIRYIYFCVSKLSQIQYSKYWIHIFDPQALLNVSLVWWTALPFNSLTTSGNEESSFSFIFHNQYLTSLHWFNLITPFGHISMNVKSHQLEHAHYFKYSWERQSAANVCTDTSLVNSRESVFLTQFCHRCHHNVGWIPFLRVLLCYLSDLANSHVLGQAKTIGQPTQHRDCQKHSGIRDVTIL